MEPILFSTLPRPSGPASNATPVRMKRSWGLARFGALPIVFVSLLLAVLAIQLAHGAYSAAFDASADEGSHVVTSLMYRQFLLAPTSEPIEFARDYYSHYPSMAAGHWPPGLHLPAAIWMLIVGSGRIQLLIYLALVTAATATFLYYAIRPFAGRTLAGVFCGLWLLLTHSQEAMSRFMTEGQSALLVTAAVASYVWYLRSPCYWRATVFGLVSVAALLTRETALPLALVPPLSVALLGRWNLFGRLHFWLPAVIVVTIITPWYGWIGSLGVGRYGDISMVARILLFSESTLAHQLSLFSELLGWPLVILALSGVCARMFAVRSDRDDRSTWAVLGALLVGGLAFHLIVPESNEARHLYHLTPALMIFAAAGAWAVASRLRQDMRRVTVVLLGIICVFPSMPGFALRAKVSPKSLDTVGAAKFLSESKSAHVVLVVASAEALAGPFIAEVALRHPEPRGHLIRASKTLYSMEWQGDHYQQRLTSEDQLNQFLDESRFDAIVRMVPKSAMPRPHDVLLTAILKCEDCPWRLVYAGADESIEIYERVIPSSLPPRPIRIYMESRWGENYDIHPHNHSFGRDFY